MRKIDGKFRIEGEEILNPAGEPIPIDEPLFLIRARDLQALRTLHAYAGFCAKYDCTDYQMRGIDVAIEAFSEFREKHPERMKQPGSTRGK